MNQINKINNIYKLTSINQLHTNTQSKHNELNTPTQLIELHKQNTPTT